MENIHCTVVTLFSDYNHLLLQLGRYPRFTYPNTIVLFYLSENDFLFYLHIFLHTRGDSTWLSHVSVCILLLHCAAKLEETRK